jgi:hypothetical protein
MNQSSSVPTTPQSNEQDVIKLGLLIFAIAAAVVGLPALVAGVVLGLVARGRRPLLILLGLLAVGGIWLLYLWHQEIAADVQALLRMVGGVWRREVAPERLWEGVQVLWRQTWLATPLIALLFEMVRPRSEVEKQAEETRIVASKQRHEAQSAYTRAVRAPDQVVGRVAHQARDEPLGVLGAAGEGQAFRPRGRGSEWAVYPAGALNRHGVVIGESGKGKSEFFLRLAYLAAKTYGWRVYIIDAKGSPAFATQFCATMRKAGVQDFALFPNIPCDGWRGDAELIYNKLIACLDYSDPYYKNTVEAAVRLAVYAGQPPQTSDEFLSRFSLDFLVNVYQRDDVSLRRLEKLKKEHFDSAYMRFDAFLSSFGDAFNGHWSFEDVRAGYFLLDGVGKREQARTMGRYLIEDFAQAVTRRLPPDEFSLLIIDEYPALAGAGEAARLFEQVRSPHGRGGAGVFVGAQSYASLGEDADRMIQAANATIVFQCADPERIVARAGQQLVKRRGYAMGTGAQSSSSGSAFPSAGRRHETFSQREERDYALSPDAVRRLQVGQCYIIPSGAYQQVTVSRVPLSDAELADARLVTSVRRVKRRPQALSLPTTSRLPPSHEPPSHEPLLPESRPSASSDDVTF